MTERPRPAGDRLGFRREQHGVMLGMAAAAVVTVAGLGWAVTAPLPATGDPLAERIAATSRADVLVVVWLAAGIANVARLRFFSASDIAGSSHGAASDQVRRAGAILLNTLEQVVLAVLAHLIVAVSFEHPGRAVTVLVTLFCAGRLLFWIGYRHGARARALGFGLSFYPSIAALIASAGTLI